jgi:hypothetical protein
VSTESGQSHVDVIGVGDVNVVGDAVVFEKTST